MGLRKTEKAVPCTLTWAAPHPLLSCLHSLQPVTDTCRHALLPHPHEVLEIQRGLWLRTVQSTWCRAGVGGLGGHGRPETSSQEEGGGEAGNQISGAGLCRLGGPSLPLFLSICAAKQAPSVPHSTFQNHDFQPRRQARDPGDWGGSEGKGLQREHLVFLVPTAVPEERREPDASRASWGAPGPHQARVGGRAKSQCDKEL